MDTPLVSVICLCHNHAQYVEAAILSVVHQTYPRTELIVVDDCSTDGSGRIIKKLSKIHGFKAIFNEERLGNCKAFNRGFASSEGKYVIDLAADDYLMDERIAVGADVLEYLGDEYAVHFCDVALLLPDGTRKGTHYQRDASGKLIQEVPSGDIYLDLVARYTISAPAMLIRAAVLQELGGYDESLSYEDFDFWVRSARKYKYAFSDEILVAKRLLPGSLSSGQHRRKNPHAMSTARVCEKVYAMNQTAADHAALLTRIRYELRQALMCECWDAAAIHINLMKKIAKNPWPGTIAQIVLAIKPPWFGCWNFILRSKAIVKNKQ